MDENQNEETTAVEPTEDERIAISKKTIIVAAVATTVAAAAYVFVKLRTKDVPNPEEVAEVIVLTPEDVIN